MVDWFYEADQPLFCLVGRRREKAIMNTGFLDSNIEEALFC
jgi:hypothetical protein